MVFQDEYLQLGEQGGRAAAEDLNVGLQEFISGNFPTITSPKIVTSIFANVKELSENSVKAGIIGEAALLADFARGFNSSIALFDFVDVGQATDQATDKIKSMHVINSFVTGVIF